MVSRHGDDYNSKPIAPKVAPKARLQLRRNTTPDSAGNQWYWRFSISGEDVSYAIQTSLPPELHYTPGEAMAAACLAAWLLQFEVMPQIEMVSDATNDPITLYYTSDMPMPREI